MFYKRLFCVALLLLTGCGYHIVKPKAAIEGKSRIFVAFFKNDTPEAGIEAILKNNVTSMLFEKTNMTVVSDRGLADVILSGNILGLEIKDISYSPLDDAIEYRVYMKIYAVLQTSEGRTIWSDTFKRFNEYPVAGNIVFAQNNKAIVIDMTLKDITRDIYTGIFERF